MAKNRLKTHKNALKSKKNIKNFSVFVNYYTFALEKSNTTILKQTNNSFKLYF